MCQAQCLGLQDAMLGTTGKASFTFRGSKQKLPLSVTFILNLFLLKSVSLKREIEGWYGLLLQRAWVYNCLQLYLQIICFSLLPSPGPCMHVVHIDSRKLTPVHT